MNAKPGRKNQPIPFDELPNSLRKFRLGRNLSLAQLAQRIGVNENSLSEYELKGTGLGKMGQWKLAVELDVEYQLLVAPGPRFAERLRRSINAAQTAVA